MKIVHNVLRLTKTLDLSHISYLISWLTMTRKPGKYCMRYTGTLDSCFDPIRSHQQCIPWSPPLEIEPATTDPKLYHWATGPHRTEALLNQPVMVNVRPTKPDVSCSYIRTLTEDTVYSRTTSSKLGDTRLFLRDHNLISREIDIHICERCRPNELWLD